MKRVSDAVLEAIEHLFKAWWVKKQKGNGANYILDGRRGRPDAYRETDWGQNLEICSLKCLNFVSPVYYLPAKEIQAEIDYARAKWDHYRNIHLSIEWINLSGDFERLLDVDLKAIPDLFEFTYYEPIRPMDHVDAFQQSLKDCLDFFLEGLATNDIHSDVGAYAELWTKFHPKIPFSRETLRAQVINETYYESPTREILGFFLDWEGTDENLESALKLSRRPRRVCKDVSYRIRNSLQGITFF